MITLGIIRRAMRRALQWRLLLLSPVVLLAAAAATFLPLSRFFGDLFDHSPRWQEITASLDSSALAGLGRAMMSPGAAGIVPAVQTSLVLAVIFAPLLAGAALFVAQTDGRPKLRGLLAGAIAYYGRLLRMQIAALVPLGLAIGVVIAVMTWSSHASDRATSDAATHTTSRIAWLLSLGAVFLGQLVIDAGRARLAAEPTRRSALLALGAGVKLIVKRPVQTLAVGLSANIVALLVAAVLLVLRQQITQSGTGGLLLAFVLSQLAVASIAWGHAAKLCGLLEIARELAASHAAPKAATSSPQTTGPATDAGEPADIPPGSVLAPAPRHRAASPVEPLPAVPTLPVDSAPAVAPPES
jgi:hypothetical protein